MPNGKKVKFGGAKSQRAAASPAGSSAEAGAGGASSRASRIGRGERGKPGAMRVADGGADLDMAEDDDGWEDEEDDDDMWAPRPSRGLGGKSAARGGLAAPASQGVRTSTHKSRSAATGEASDGGGSDSVDDLGDDGRHTDDDEGEAEELDADHSHDDEGEGGGGRFRGRGDTRTTHASAHEAIQTYDHVAAAPPGSATAGLGARVVDSLWKRTFGMRKEDGTHKKLLERGVTGGPASLVEVFPFPDT